MKKIFLRSINIGKYVDEIVLAIILAFIFAIVVETYPSNNYIKLTCIIMIIIIWLIFRKITKKNRLTRELFEKFQRGNYVNKFEMMVKSNQTTYSGYGFGSIIDRLSENKDLTKKNELEIIINYKNIIMDQFVFWKRVCLLLGKHIDFADFLLIIEGFSTIVINYHRYCIEKSRNVITKGETTRDWKKAMSDYEYFRNSYNDFIDDINKMFELSEEMSKLPPPIYISITS